jgi:hypothetical protein
MILLCLSLAGCEGKPAVGAPWMQDLLNNGPKGGTDLFKKGWQDGCETGISVTSNALQRHFYRFKQDSSLAGNHEYYTGWSVAYTYCQRYVFQYLRRQYL